MPPYKQEYLCRECGAVIKELLSESDAEIFERIHGEPQMHMPEVGRARHARDAHGLKKCYADMFAVVTAQ